MSSKGQIVIPRKIRNELQLDKDSVMVIGKIEEGIAIKKIDIDLVRQVERSLEDIKHGRIKEWKG